jgi:phage terminase large subunit GpA-like protein
MDRNPQWSNATCPFLVGVMDAVLTPGVRTVTVIESSQIGGSEALCNVMGYFATVDPAPVLAVWPTMSAPQPTPALRRSCA